MNKYKMTIPYLRMDTRPFEIFDVDNNKVGTLQRYYKNRLTMFMDLIFCNWFINLLVKDLNGKTRANCEEIVSIKSILNEKWKIELFSQEDSSSFTAISKTKINTHPRLLYERNNREVLVCKNFGDKIVRFMDNVKDEILAEIIPGGIIPPNSYIIDICVHNSFLNIYEVSCIYYLFELKS